MSLNEILEGNTEYKKLIIIRSAAPSKELGHLPGNIKEKTRIYEIPYISICSELFGRNDAYEILSRKGIIEFISTSFLRGTTFKNSIVFLDEFQNGTLHEIHTCMTRVGDNCRLIVSGDINQTDLNKPHEASGGLQAIDIMQNMPSFSSFKFGIDDIVRSGVVREWIISKDKLKL